jgi:Secretion system C-terminal sorting domain
MMKKLLLMSAVLAAFYGNAQILQTDDFNSLTLGNVAGSISGTVTGQGGYYLSASNGAAPTTSNNAAASLCQIVSTANGSKGLSLSGLNGDKGGVFVWKDGLDTAWAARTSGNNIIEVEVDIYLGARSTAINLNGMAIYESTFSNALTGFLVNTSTGELNIFVYSTPSGNPVGNYFYPLAAAPGIVLPENAFSRIGISYDKTTNIAKIKAPGLPATGATINSSAGSVNPVEVDFASLVGAPANTASGNLIFDNLIVRASSTDTLLSNNSFDLTNNIKMYPNPAKDVLNIDRAGLDLTSVTIADLNGRTVKEVKNNVETISISDLSSGIYMVTINTENGKKVEKLIVE